MKKVNWIYIALAALLIVGCLGIFKFRFDLTAEKRYTLSENTEKIIKSVQGPLLVDVYLEGDFPASFKQLQGETRFMLEEFRRLNPKIDFKFIDPIKSKIPQDTLMGMGMMPSALPEIKDGKVSQTIIYPYAVLKYKEAGMSVPLIVDQAGTSSSEQLTKSIENLEYSLVSSIKTLTATKRKNIGILINQDELKPDEFQSFMQIALENYNAFPIIPANETELTIADVPNLRRTDALVVAKPRKAFTEGEKVILDQYIMNGGRTMWMMEAVNAEMDSLTRSKSITSFPVDVNMSDFFFNYGVRINPVLVKDLQKFALLRLVTGEVSGNPQFMSLPWPYFPLGIAENNNPITKNINPVKFDYPSSIDTLGKPGIKTNVLYESSERTIVKRTPSLVDLKEIASVDSLAMLEQPSTPKIFAVSLEGKFTSGYASRSERKEFPGFIAKGAKDNKMIVIADGDIARNTFAKGQPLPLGMDMLTNQQYGNEQFLRNTLDYLLDDSNLIELRNRNIESRLLDRQLINEERGKWQMINLVLPLVIIGLLGGIFFYIRKKKFTA